MRLQLQSLGCVLLAALLPFHSTDPAAGTAVRMDLESLVDTADLVLEGRILLVRSLEDSSGRIVTDYEVVVDRTFTGEHRERRTVRLPGGVLPSGRGLMIPGLPSLSQGENVILALSEPGQDGLRMPTGLSQGKFRILPGADGLPKAVRGGAGASLTQLGGEHEEAGIEVLGYADLVSRLEAAANAKALGSKR